MATETNLYTFVNKLNLNAGELYCCIVVMFFRATTCKLSSIKNINNY